MIAFIEDHSGVHGVEPICRVLAIAPSTYYAQAAIARDPDLASDRARRDIIDKAEIKKPSMAAASDMARARSGMNCAGTITISPAARWSG